MRPASQHLVLAGGGHAHVFVLEAFAKSPKPGLRITLIAKEILAPYSGMLPGYVAGLYTHAQCHIDLARLCQRAGVTLIHAAANGIDAANRTVSVTGHPPLSYDVLSIDIGSTPSPGLLVDAPETAIAVKPISVFVPKWQALAAKATQNPGLKTIAVVGTGAAGFELALAIRAKLNKLAAAHRRDPPAITLIGSGRLLDSFNAKAQSLARAALAARAVQLIENDGACALTPVAVQLMSGREVPADAILIATGSSAPQNLANISLAVDGNGYLAIQPTLQIVGQTCVFAAGDCATMIEHPRPKAGVFAVRQGPVLAANIRRVLDGELAQPYVPQKQFLTLLSLGDETAIAAKGRFAAQGRWVWRWKDWIDRGFVERFNSQ